MGVTIECLEMFLWLLLSFTLWFIIVKGSISLALRDIPSSLVSFFLAIIVALATASKYIRVHGGKLLSPVGILNSERREGLV